LQEKQEKREERRIKRNNFIKKFSKVAIVTSLVVISSLGTLMAARVSNSHNGMEIQTLKVQEQLRVAQVEIGELKVQIKELEQQINNITPVVEVVQSVVPELRDVELIEGVYENRVDIAYFSQYWNRLSSTKVQLFDSMSNIVVNSDDNWSYISTEFKSNDIEKQAKLKVGEDGYIYFSNCSQWEAEVIMQKLLEELL